MDVLNLSVKFVDGTTPIDPVVPVVPGNVPPTGDIMTVFAFIILFILSIASLGVFV